MRIDPLAESGDKLCEEPSVHVPGHLVKHKPVANAAVEDVVLDVPGITRLLEVTVHLPFYQQKS